mgnify:CR=1 FL=1
MFPIANSRFGSHQPNSPARPMPTKIELSPKNESNPPTQSIACGVGMIMLGSDRLNLNTRIITVIEGANAQRQPKWYAMKPPPIPPDNPPNTEANTSTKLVCSSASPPYIKSEIAQGVLINGVAAKPVNSEKLRARMPVKTQPGCPEWNPRWHSGHAPGKT